MAASSHRRIVLLREINLASRRRVCRADLRELLAGHGYEDVRRPPERQRRAHEQPSGRAAREKAAARARGRARVEIEVIVRTRAESPVWSPATRLARRNDPSRYLVTFLGAKPPAKLVGELRPPTSRRTGHGEGREIYSWHPDGLQRSPLAKLLSKTAAKAPGTNRNWRS